jgi:hypothetical protein
MIFVNVSFCEGGTMYFVTLGRSFQFKKKNYMWVGVTIIRNGIILITLLPCVLGGQDETSTKFVHSCIS